VAVAQRKPEGVRRVRAAKQTSRPVIDNYDSFTYNLVHYAQELGANTKVVRNDDLSVEEALNMGAKAILLSPGPCTPNEAGICLDLIANAPNDLPILGICLGQQSIGQAFGGKVIRRYHSLSVERESLPKELLINAWTEDGEIMALRHATRPIHGLQFHPESIASENGHKLIGKFLELMA